MIPEKEYYRFTVAMKQLIWAYGCKNAIAIKHSTNNVEKHSTERELFISSHLFKRELLISSYSTKREY
jgi:hypothetical protein